MFECNRKYIFDRAWYSISPENIQKWFSYAIVLKSTINITQSRSDPNAQ